ncbi:MAG: hypothetical protein O2954_04600 [bacterium]|nr:hypothetical protein [bacterium]
MKTRFSHFLLGGCFLLAAGVLSGCGSPEQATEENLQAHVLFFSNFEKGVDALSSAGPTLAELDGARTRQVASNGVAETDQTSDGYLAFEPGAGALSYQAPRNFPYNASGAWSGAVAFWMDVDPKNDLKANYPEPFHIGKGWDDAVIFVDFDKKNTPLALRFGCYPDKEGDITDQMVEQRVIRVEGLNWKSGEWHHVVITWSNFNSGKANAEWALFVDGVEKGRKKNLHQDLTWTLAEQTLRFNHVDYIGKIDELAIFDTMLTAQDAKYLVKPRRPLNLLLKKDR